MNHALAIAGVGHNKAPQVPAIDPDELTAALEEQYRSHLARRDSLLAAFTRFDAANPKIVDDDIAGRASDFCKQLKREVRLVDGTNGVRDQVKRPFLNACETIDTFFRRNVAAPLKRRADEIEDRLSTYAREKEEAARRAAIEAHWEAEIEAERLAAAAARSRTPALIEDLAQARNAVDLAAERASAPAAELTRVRGDLGAVSSTRVTLAFRVVDKGKVPLAWLSVNEAAVRATMAATRQRHRTVAEAAADLGLAIPGIEFYEEKRVIVR